MLQSCFLKSQLRALMELLARSVIDSKSVTNYSVL